MTWIAEGGGGVRLPQVPAQNPAPKTPAKDAAAEAAARARELQRQLEALQAKLREAQRKAEEARKRALEAQREAEKARKEAEAAKEKAEKTKAEADRAAAKKAEQAQKLADARQKKESAEAQLRDKELDLLRAKIAQKKEQKESPDAKASAKTDARVNKAQDQRDGAQRTLDLSKLNLDHQEKETKAQAAEAKAATLAPAPGRPSSTISAAETKAYNDAQAEAKTLRDQANAAKAQLTEAIGEQAGTQFHGEPSGADNPAFANDPLHSPLEQLLKVSPGPAFSPYLLQPTLQPSTTTSTPTSSPTTPTSASLFGQPAQPSEQVNKTLNGIADGKSLEQIAKERGVSVQQLQTEARSAGVTLTPGKVGGPQQTTVQRGGNSLTYTHDPKKNTTRVNGSFVDPKAPGGRKTIEATRDGDGRYTQTQKDDKTGKTTTHIIDPKAGTRTDIVNEPNGRRTETTTDLTGAPVHRKVQPGEGYLDVAKAAGITPEQLLALNPDVDYGKPLKPGQELVVSGVRTTTKTTQTDGTSLEKTVASDGTQRVVATTADGRRIVLMGDPDKQDGPGEKIRKGLFEDNKTVAQLAKDLGMTEEQVLAALPAGTVNRTLPTSDNGDVETRTIYDPKTNRTVVETHDWQHDSHDRKLIDEKDVFKVRQYNPETKQYEIVEVKGGVGYAQKLADDKLKRVGELNQDIADLDVAIRYAKRMGESTSELLAQRQQLVSLRDSAQGEADIEQGLATSTLIKHQQDQIDKIAANTYQRLAYARPGSKEQKQAQQDLNDILALADKVDRLDDAALKDIEFLKTELDKNQKHQAKTDADARLQTEFLKWKNEVWGWEGIPEERKKEMKAEGQRPPGQPMYRNAEEENDAAWKAFVERQKFLDDHGNDQYLRGDERAARNAWLQRNAASTAELKANGRYYDASVAKSQADSHVLQGDIARLQDRQDAWVQDHPKDFRYNSPYQKQLDQLKDQKTQIDIGGLKDGQAKKLNQYLLDKPVAEREDPQKLKEITQQYSQDHAEELEKLDQRINDLLMAGANERAQASEAYIAQWAKDNPELQKKLDALGTTTGSTSVRAAEHRMELRNQLLQSSHEGQQLQAALNLKYDTQFKLSQVGEQDEQRLQKDLDEKNQRVEGQTWLRDVFSDTAEDARDYTQDQLDKAKQLRSDLANGKLTLTEYTKQRNELMDQYGLKSVDLAGDLRDSDQTWSTVDSAVRMTVSAAAGIVTTLATGGNVAAGFAVGMAVNQLWDTSNDIYAAANGRDIYADGHSSLVTLGYRSLFDRGNLTGDQVALTFKDDAVDTLHAAVSSTGLWGGLRTSAALTTRLAASKGVDLAAGQTLSWGSRAVVGSTSGVVAQGVDGAGRVGVETVSVALDGKFGTVEGNQRISHTLTASFAGLTTAPLTGGVSAAIALNPAKIFGVGLGAQFGNDAVSSLATGDLISLMNNGRHMNQGEFIAASMQALPGTALNIALHPSLHAARVAGESETPEVTLVSLQRPPTGPDGSPMLPTTLNRVSWEDVARDAPAIIDQHRRASESDPDVTPLQPSASETAVLNWLRQDPQGDSGTVFVVSRLGPSDTIYGSTGGVRARNSDTYGNFADACAAAAKLDGAWVNRVQPNPQGLPLQGRRRVGADEIVGSMYVDRGGDVLPVGIPNTRHAEQLMNTSGVPSWKRGTKSLLSAEPDNPRINPLRMLGIASGVRVTAEIMRSVYGVGFGSGLLGGKVASVAPGPLSSFGRIAYLSSSQRGKEALAAATAGDKGTATKLIDKVINGTGWRGDKVLNETKAQALRHDINRVGDAGVELQQALKNLRADAPSAKLFRLHTLDAPDESVAKLWGDYMTVPGMKRFLQGLRNEEGGELHGQAPSEAQKTVLKQLEGLGADQLQRMRDDDQDNSAAARVLRAFPAVYDRFHRTAEGRAALRNAQQALYNELVSMVGKDGVIDLGKAEGLAGSTNSPNTELGKFSRRAVILTNVNLTVGALFKSQYAGNSFTIKFANTADFFTVGTAGMNIIYNIKVEKLASVEASIDSAAAKANMDRADFLKDHQDGPAWQKKLDDAKDAKDAWNKYRDYSGFTSAARAFGQAALFGELDFSAVPGGHVIQPALVGASIAQGTLQAGWVALQQIKPLRNGNLPKLTRGLKWGTAIAVVAVPVASQVTTAFFQPAGEKKEGLVESWWKMLLPEPKPEPSPYRGGLPGTVPATHAGDPQQADWAGRVDPQRVPVLEPLFVTVNDSDPRTATATGIADNNIDSLLSGPALFRVHVEGEEPGAVRREALAQLFNLNPSLNRDLMDGVLSDTPGDPDLLLDGWNLKVGERWAAA